MTPTPISDRRPAILRELAWFLTGAFVPFACMGAMAAGAGGLSHWPLITPLGMLTPMLSGLVVQKFVARRPILGPEGLGFSWGRMSWWLVAPCLAAALVAAAILASFVVTPALAASKAQIVLNLAHLQSLPGGLDPAGQLAAAFALTLLAAPLINLPIFLGEEVGWRGFMNPRLIELMGRPGLIVGGAFWALWHLPIILLGHNYPQHPWLGLLVWIPVCACVNILLHAVRRVSGSIFPCALAHGAMNQIATLMLVLFVREDRFIDVLHGPAGLIGLLVLLPATIWTWRFLRRPAAIRVGRRASAHVVLAS